MDQITEETLPGVTMQILESIQAHYNEWFNGGPPPSDPCPALKTGDTFEYAYKTHTGSYCSVEGVFRGFVLEDYPNPIVGRVVWMRYTAMSRRGKTYEACSDICQTGEGSIWPAHLDWHKPQSA